ncbi:hypothetical protein Q9S36_28800 [Microbacterium sp. ARD31]|uniref:hypothetical protein n=1 Tax=Microbacterium sp. ARD31 TaxID=2962576 RepID=UPI00288127E0|nr:hypothetical protein [Microbacterium sp. ARD31]MDT0184199.1 hypothetical protein [Microbacterium sp. ARD31]
MNTTIQTGDVVRRGSIAVAAAAACFAFAACGTEVAPPTQDIGGTQQETTDAPAQPTRTSPTRGEFGDEYGTARPGQRSGSTYDPIDRTRDWH